MKPKTSAKVKTPTKIQKVRKTNAVKPIQKAPPPLISQENAKNYSEKPQQLPVQNQQPISSDNDPDVVFPELIQEHVPGNNNVQFVQNTTNEHSVEFLESKTSCGKYSKAPKVPSGGGDKICLNLGTINLDSSSKISNPDGDEVEEIEIEEPLDE